jgi:RNA recognition motif-containing protein
LSKSRSRSRDRNHKHKSHKEDRDKEKSNKKEKRNERKTSDDGIKLYLSNLGSNVSEKKIMDEFKYYGEVIDISVKRKNGKSNYFGYIIMRSRSSAEKAMKEISKSFGWKITLYEKEERSREKHRSKSSSRSRSRSKEKIENTQGEDESKKTEENRPVRVREIWVGALPNSITEQSLYNQFFIFGEISKMDCHFQTDKNYAFIRYRLSSSASRAYEKAKNMNLNGSIIRVSFSDSSKRREIIGDEEGYEVTEKNCKLLHMSLNKGSTLASESTIRDLLKKYGTIKGFHIKNTQGYRPTIYVEYSKPEEAEQALQNLTSLDTNNEKKTLLGDPFCDINYDFKKKLNFLAQANGTADNKLSNIQQGTVQNNMGNMMMNPGMVNPQMIMYQNYMMQMNPQYSNIF